MSLADPARPGKMRHAQNSISSPPLQVTGTMPAAEVPGVQGGQAVGWDVALGSYWLEPGVPGVVPSSSFCFTLLPLRLPRKCAGHHSPEGWGCCWGLGNFRVSKCCSALPTTHQAQRYSHSLQHPASQAHSKPAAGMLRPQEAFSFSCA